MELCAPNVLRFLFVTLLLSMLICTLCGAYPLYTFCSNGTSNYTVNSPFGENLKILFQNLPSFTASSGFNNTAIGETPNIVYGQALCRGDINNSTVCYGCVESASGYILTNCMSKEAIVWYELCHVHYSFQDFLSSQVYTGKYPDLGNQMNYVVDPISFNQALADLFQKLSKDAAFSSSNRMFATGEKMVSRNETIFGLVQCTRDISEQDCLDCLGSALGDLKACCNSRQSGYILSRNCNLRFELYQFYTAHENTSKGIKLKTWIIILVSVVSVLVLAVVIGYLKRDQGNVKDDVRRQSALLQELENPKREEADFVGTEELPFMDLTIIRAATDNFSDLNKLGQGGFGTVYKGVLQDGREIAVKRLLKTSRQGLEEFKNEIILIARVQHRNLVRLMGCSIEEDEKLLVYEFMPNRSLDFFIFDQERRERLGWKTWHEIIVGIAKGLLYLHEDSRLKIIHRDLKPNNVLLDHGMVAKISDFGMARIFGKNQHTANTKRVVGTYGYMAPEYAMEGLFSVKSDVFSFGVLLLEIIFGKKNSGFYRREHAKTLLAYVWHLWNEGRELEIVEPFLLQTCSALEVIRFIHIGLLCVQEDPDYRPTMSYVVTLLGNHAMALPQPKQPPFSAGLDNHRLSSSYSKSSITISDLSPR